MTLANLGRSVAIATGLLLCVGEAALKGLHLAAVNRAPLARAQRADQRLLFFLAEDRPTRKRLRANGSATK